MHLVLLRGMEDQRTSPYLWLQDSANSQLRKRKQQSNTLAVSRKIYLTIQTTPAQAAALQAGNCGWPLSPVAFSVTVGAMWLNSTAAHRCQCNCSNYLSQSSNHKHLNTTPMDSQRT